MLKRGDSACVFQFESAGMQKILKDAQPNNIEDLVALNALYRPGPMQYIDRYVACKNGVQEIPGEGLALPHENPGQEVHIQHGEVFFC